MGEGSPFRATAPGSWRCAGANMYGSADRTELLAETPETRQSWRENVSRKPIEFGHIRVLGLRATDLDTARERRSSMVLSAHPGIASPEADQRRPRGLERWIL